MCLQNAFTECHAIRPTLSKALSMCSWQVPRKHHEERVGVGVGVAVVVVVVVVVVGVVVVVVVVVV